MASNESRRFKIVERVGGDLDRWKVIHVIPSKSEWVVKREQAQRASRIFPTQREAVEFARSLAKGANGELIVHRRDGTMQERQIVEKGNLRTVYAHGDDPLPPKN